MSDTAVYILIAVGALAVLALLAVVLGRRGEQRRLTPLAGLALACVVSGIVFGEDRVVGYGFFAAGISLAVVDAVRRSRGGPGPSGPAARR